jgi:gliding motility-associated-like protein
MKGVEFKFIAFLFLITNIIFAQNDCSGAIVVCGNTGFSGLTANGAGNIEEIGALNSCGSFENNSIWLKLLINTSGTLGFTLTPQSANIEVDFDFFIFGPNTACNNLGTSIRCSTTNPQASNQNNNHTGMNNLEIDTSEGPGQLGNSFLKWLTVSAGDTYYLIIDRPIGSSNFSIQWTGTATFNSPPTFDLPTGVALNLSECDNGFVYDGKTNFDLNQNNSVIVGSQTNVAVTYHLSQNDATIGENAINTNSSYENISNPETLYARVTNNASGCYNTTTFDLKVYPEIIIPKTTFSKCDDANDGDDENGKTTFDLNEVSNWIFNNQNSSDLTFNYYSNQLDANSNSNPLGLFFTNSIPNQTSVFVKVSNANGCEKTKEIVLNVISLPTKNTVTLTQCDTTLNPDGISLFNLSQADQSFLNGDPNLSLTYFENLQQEQNNIPLVSNYTNLTNNQTIIAKITNLTTNCSSNSQLILKVNLVPSQNVIPLEECDVLNQENGLATFDLSLAQIALTPAQIIKFYPSLDDALLEQNEIITNIANYINVIPYLDRVFMRIEDSNSCARISEVKLIVNTLPNINILSTDNTYVCSNLPQRFETIDAGIITGSPAAFAYQWYLDGNPISNNFESIKVNKAGIYTVDVRNANNCIKTRTIEVKASSDATFKEILIVDGTLDENTVTINLMNSIGNYEYSIDNPEGPFQESNFFDKVNPGIHTVYVNDIYGCGLVERTIAVIGFPAFFTPNGDGYNDFWSIDGVNKVFNTNSRVYIFDRFGKLVKEIAPRDSKGWDGNYRGAPLMADDYWYVIYLEDGRIVKGHFALKR